MTATYHSPFRSYSNRNDLNASIGLCVAVGIHLAIIFTYNVAMIFLAEDSSVTTVQRPPFQVDFWQRGVEEVRTPTLSPVSPISRASRKPAHNATPVPVSDPSEQILPSAGFGDSKTEVDVEDGPGTGTTGAGDIDGVVETADQPLDLDKDLIEVRPEVVVRHAPEYPRLAQLAGLEGAVLVRVLIDKEGRVIKAEIAQSSHASFNQVSLDAALKWVFTPALMTTGPVLVWATIPFKFTLRN